jgi:hypothetical protein
MVLFTSHQLEGPASD